jgi:hypothetical protein
MAEEGRRRRKYTPVRLGDRTEDGRDLEELINGRLPRKKHLEREQFIYNCSHPPHIHSTVVIVDTQTHFRRPVPMTSLVW